MPSPSPKTTRSRRSPMRPVATIVGIRAQARLARVDVVHRRPVGRPGQAVRLGDAVQKAVDRAVGAHRVQRPQAGAAVRRAGADQEAAGRIAGPVVEADVGRMLERDLGAIGRSVGAGERDAVGAGDHEPAALTQRGRTQRRAHFGQGMIAVLCQPVDDATVGIDPDERAGALVPQRALAELGVVGVGGLPCDRRHSRTPVSASKRCRCAGSMCRPTGAPIGGCERPRLRSTIRSPPATAA